MPVRKLSVHAWWSMGFGLGLSACAPGTMGTLMGVVLAAILSLFPHWIALLVLVGLTLYSVWAAKVFSAQLQLKDPSCIVSDEVVGFMWSVICLPCNGGVYACAFILFRFFDITKIGPISWLDRQNWPGWSIVLDDCCAGLFAWFFLWLLLNLRLVVV